MQEQTAGPTLAGAERTGRPQVASPFRSNATIADILDRVARLLEAQGASGVRVAPWRDASLVVRDDPRAFASLATVDGDGGLDGVPGIDSSRAAAIDEIARTGRLRYLGYLEGEPMQDAFAFPVPGIGPALAHRIGETLDIHTLEELELAAHDGRLAQVRGMGPTRARAVAEAVGTALGRAPRRRALPASARPPVPLLLDVDAMFREADQRGALVRVEPRFEVVGEQTLPIMHLERDGWCFTAQYASSPRARALGRTRDWVVIHAEKNGREGHATVLSAPQGLNRGQRVVRGRERGL